MVQEGDQHFGGVSGGDVARPRTRHCALLVLTGLVGKKEELRAFGLSLCFAAAKCRCKNNRIVCSRVFTSRGSELKFRVFILNMNRTPEQQ